MTIQLTEGCVTKRQDDDARMRQLVAEMSVISEARGQQFGDVIHGGSDPSRPPRGPRVSMADYHAEAWRRARTLQQRLEALEAAEAELLAARLSPRGKHQFEAGTLEMRLAIANAEGHAKEVARKFGVSVSHVYNMRKISGKRFPRAA